MTHGGTPEGFRRSNRQLLNKNSANSSNMNIDMITKYAAEEQPSPAVKHKQSGGGLPQISEPGPQTDTNLSKTPNSNGGEGTDRGTQDGQAGQIRLGSTPGDAGALPPGGGESKSFVNITGLVITSKKHLLKVGTGVAK